MDEKANLQTQLRSPIGELLKFEKPIQCDADFPLSDVINLLADNNIGSVVVVEDNKPIGIITERDIIRRVLRPGVDIKTAKVAKYMTRALLCVQMSTPFHRIIAGMREAQFRHLVVIHENGDLAGVFSMRSVFYRLDDMFLAYLK